MIRKNNSDIGITDSQAESTDDETKSAVKNAHSYFPQLQSTLIFKNNNFFMNQFFGKMFPAITN